MTPLQILAAAIRGTPAPRIPVFCNLLDQGARTLGMRQQAYYARGEHVAEAQLKMRARYGHDNVWSLFYVGKEAELLGSREILFAENGAPNVADFVIRNYDDVARLEIPEDITAHPAWEETAKCLSILRQEVGGTHPVCAYLTASTTLPALLMGMDKWMDLLMTGPADVRDELLAKCSACFPKQAAASRAAGGVGDIVYYCGMATVNSVIPQVMAELGIGVYYLSPQDDLAEAKTLIGGKALACGVIDDIQLIRWTPEETRAEVKRLCAAGMVDGRFLFGTGVMPQAVPEANIEAMVNAAFEFGSYP